MHPGVRARARRRDRQHQRGLRLRARGRARPGRAPVARTPEATSTAMALSGTDRPARRGGSGGPSGGRAACTCGGSAEPANFSHAAQAALGASRQTSCACMAFGTTRRRRSDLRSLPFAQASRRAVARCIHTARAAAPRDRIAGQDASPGRRGCIPRPQRRGVFKLNARPARRAAAGLAKARGRLGVPKTIRSATRFWRDQRARRARTLGRNTGSAFAGRASPGPWPVRPLPGVQADQISTSSTR